VSAVNVRLKFQRPARLLVEARELVEVERVTENPDFIGPKVANEREGDGHGGAVVVGRVKVWDEDVTLVWSLVCGTQASSTFLMMALRQCS
jgi:hypothetical protein